VNTKLIIAPAIGGYQRAFRKLCLTIEGSGPCHSINRQTAITAARSELLTLDRLGLTSNELKFSTCSSVILDLLEQGWNVHVAKSVVEVIPPDKGDESAGDNKIRVRNAHLVSRNADLSRPAVRKFIDAIETPRLTRAGWHSIHSLMRDGKTLSDQLRTIRSACNPSQLPAQLRTAIDPYLEAVDGEDRCSFTGLPLGDIWRYFRYTWINPPQSVPGRSIRFLIRDRAAKNHPIIGIAALASSTAQQTVRDRWIGWEGQRLADWINAKTHAQLRRWISLSLKRFIRAIYIEDFVKLRVLARAEIRRPTTATIARLTSAAATALQHHREHPHLATHKGAGGKTRQTMWRQQATTSLFVAKRAKTLASLLKVRLAIAGQKHQPNSTNGSIASLRKLASQLSRAVKAEHVGANMMDITTCGAIAPYNHLLGGKLVCMLLASPEVREEYGRRYATRPSIIASSMQGAQVRRPCDLVLLMTTSLFGKSSSQYNRIRVKVGEITGTQNENLIEYVPLGRSIGFGSHHFSRLTISLMEQLIGRDSEGRKVNSIFGEGVNPLMRKIRDALLLLGLPGDLLRHGNPRIVYALPLAANFREMLRGEEAKPRFYVPRSTKTGALAKYWRQRWLANRILNDDVLQRVSRETLTYPLAHGACVRREAVTNEADLFNLATESPLAKAS
jgi:hypothetical protein